MSAVSPELIPLEASTLVEASAGTGKTYAITTYFVRAILEQGLTPEKILVVTYTKAATAELRVRSRGRILQALAHLDGPPEEPDTLHEVVSGAVAKLGRPEVERRLRAALGQMDQAAILTIHGFCQRLLQEYPLTFGVDLDFDVAEDMASLHADLAVDFWATELYAKPEWLLQALRDRKVSIDHLKKLANVASMPGVELIGPEPRAVDDDAMGEVLRLHRRAADLWFEHRETVIALLGHEGLYKQIYRSEKIRDKWAPELSGLFKQATFRALPGYFKWLCTANIEKKTRNELEPPKHPFFDACEALLEAHERIEPMLAYAVFRLQARFCDFVRERSRARREETAVFSFDDLLTAVHGAVRADASVANTVRAAYPLALVDEFQDTDSVQYGIFRSIYGEGAAVYVGDPKQAIYAFRGADVFSYIEAARDVEGGKHTLGTNRRSDPGLVGAVNTLFSRRAPPFLIEGIDFKDANAHETKSRSTLTPLELVWLEKDALEGPVASCVAPVVANEVALLLQSGAMVEGQPPQPGDIAVLCRSNKQAIAVTKELRALNVPTSLDGDASVLNTEIATDLWAVLEAALMPGDSRTVRRALLTSLVGVSPMELASMEDEVWSSWVSRFREWNVAWHEQGVLRFLEDMLGTTGAETKIASSPTARRDLTDLLHLQELLLRGERERQRDPVALVQWFRRLNEGTRDEGMIAIEDLQQRPDAQSGAVRVTTIHKSKGLEYGIVFCPFTWNDASLWPFDRVAVKFHDEDGSLKLDLGSPELKEHLEASEREAASEAIRLLYVAVTRAKHQCTLFWGPGYRWKDSALAYLLYDDDALAKKLSEDELRAGVQALVDAAGGNAGWRPPRLEKAAARHADNSDLRLEPRAQTRFFDHEARTASFTSLTGHDEKAPGPSVPDTTSPLFAELPGGARTGLLLHAIFERADLDALDGEDATKTVERQLSLHGFEQSLAASVQRDLVTVASTPLMNDPALPPLSALSRDRQLRELEFMLLVERPHVGELAAILKEHGSPSLAPGYHERLAQVSGRTLQAFLHGFIDLMFEWEGRWYVADYKSNRLPAYLQPEVVEAVQREHYVLQGQLYSAAAHRYLRQRVPGYDPSKHWGGALFLFVRGMQGSESAGASVFFERQSSELLDAMDAWLGGDGGSR